MDFFNIFFQSFHVGTSSNTAASRHDIRKTLRGFRDELHISANVGACLSPTGELAQEHLRIGYMQFIETAVVFRVLCRLAAMPGDVLLYLFTRFP